MIGSREIVELINTRKETYRSQAIVDALEDIVLRIEEMEDREMRNMYAEYMKEEVLADKWQELELELVSRSK